MDEITEVSLKYAGDKKDFGKGFYVTSSVNQAISFAKKKRDLKLSSESGFCGMAFVYSFNLNTEEIGALNVLNLSLNMVEWFNYVCVNRYYPKYSDNYDIVIGKVADSQTSKIITDFMLKYSLKAKDDIKRVYIAKLKPERLVDQYCFKSNKAVDLLNKGEIRRRTIR